MIPVLPHIQIDWGTATAEVDHILRSKQKFKDTQVFKKVLLEKLLTSYIAAFIVLKCASHQWVKNVFAEMSFNGTFDNLFVKNSDQQNHVPELSESLLSAVPIRRAYLRSFATFIKKPTDKTMNE